MKNTVFANITQAIDEHRMLLVTDEAGPRLIEPYLIFESAAGDMLLHGWQQAGAFRNAPPPRWCNLHLDDIVTAQILDEYFAKPHRDYNPRSPQFHRVLYEIHGATLVESRPSIPSPRVKRPRRGPPSRHADRSPRSRWDLRG
jgi:hypothetical protein